MTPAVSFPLLFAAEGGGVAAEGPRLISIPHHELLVFWVQILVLWAAARILGALARQVGLPSVVGNLTAGLVLGPSVFGVVWGSGFDWFLPAGESASVQSGLLLGVGWFSTPMQKKMT